MVKQRSKIAAWVEAMRLRTLPVSLAGATLGIAYAVKASVFSWLPALLCLLFAVLAQIASNFANEYYDFVDGLDRPGREGPRRGVTEGDISPRAMKRATFITLAAACLLGLCVVPFAGWWLIPVGMAIALGVYAYSAGPWPLSRHGLGEVAVVVFYGIIPVNGIYLVLGHHFSTEVVLGSLSVGLLGANVLVVNNYRDTDDDRAVGKHTLSVLLGARSMPFLYALNAILAIVLMWSQWSVLGFTWIPALFLLPLMAIPVAMTRLSGRRLTPLLGLTALLMFLYALLFLLL